LLHGNSDDTQAFIVVFVGRPLRFHPYCDLTFFDNEFINIVFNYTNEIRNDFEQLLQVYNTVHTKIRTTVLYDILFDDH